MLGASPQGWHPCRVWSSPVKSPPMQGEDEQREKSGAEKWYRIGSLGGQIEILLFLRIHKQFVALTVQKDREVLQWVVLWWCCARDG